MTPVRTLALAGLSAFAGLSLIASVGAASAMVTTPASANQFTALYQDQGLSARADFNHYDHSGTRGRLGLGANAIHPEGPGNFAD